MKTAGANESRAAARGVDGGLEDAKSFVVDSFGEWTARRGADERLEDEEEEDKDD